MTERICEIDKCENPYLARGYCSKHYQRWKSHGDPLFATHVPEICTIDGCREKHCAKGLCKKHYYRKSRTGDPLHLDRNPQGPECCVEKCDAAPLARNLCGKHYSDWRLANVPGARERVRAAERALNRSKGNGAYTNWKSMHDRCYNPKSESRPRYGGRGIAVCDRWSTRAGGSFANFLEDMGPKPDWADGGIDRINPDGNYEPANCRWATMATQRQNQNGYYLC